MFNILIYTVLVSVFCVCIETAQALLLLPYLELGVVAPAELEDVVAAAPPDPRQDQHRQVGRVQQPQVEQQRHWQ